MDFKVLEYYSSLAEIKRAPTMGGENRVGDLHLLLTQQEVVCFHSSAVSFWSCCCCCLWGESDWVEFVGRDLQRHMSKWSGLDAPPSERGSAHEKLNTSLPFLNTLDFTPCIIHEVVLKLHCVTCREHWNVICDGLLVHAAVISAEMKPLTVERRVIKFARKVHFYKWLCILLFYKSANLKFSILSKTTQRIILLRSWMHLNGQICNEAANYPHLFKRFFFPLCGHNLFTFVLFFPSFLHNTRSVFRAGFCPNSSQQRS